MARKPFWENEEPEIVVLLGKAECLAGVDLPALNGFKLFSVDQELGGALDLALSMDKQG